MMDAMISEFPRRPGAGDASLAATRRLGDAVESLRGALGGEPQIPLYRLSMLLWIARKPGITTSDLENFVGLTHATASRNVELLVGEGLVYRAANIADRREANLFLTTKGRAVMARASHLMGGGE